MSEKLKKTDSQLDVYNFEQDVLFDVEASRITEYKILKGHRLEDGSTKSQEQLLRQYVTNTDRLIGKLDGTIEGEPPFDVVILLDKSARPVAWLMAELWPILARKQGLPYDQAETPELPSRYFLNIDREQWLPIVDPDHTGTYNIDAIPDEVIQGLRAIYQPIDSDVDAKTVLDGKRVLIVDEVGVTGSTLKIAAQLLEKAIPEASFDTAHWMNPGIFTDSNGSRNNDLPVWYKQHEQESRGSG